MKVFRNKDFIIFTSLVVLITALAFGLSKAVEQRNAAESRSEVKVSPSPTIDYGQIDMDQSQWVAHSLPKFGLEFKLPLQIASKMGQVKEIEQVVEKETGYTIYCFTVQSPNPNASCGSFEGRPLVIISSSTFDTTKTQIAGDFFFTDIMGYSTKNGKFYFNSASRKNLFELADLVPVETNPQEITTQSGLKVLKIHGKNYPSGNSILLPEGQIGAIINTGNTNYPGLTIHTTLTDTFTEEVFDQIVSTIKFSK